MLNRYGLSSLFDTEPSNVPEQTSTKPVPVKPVDEVTKEIEEIFIEVEETQSENLQREITEFLSKQNIVSLT